MFGGLFLGAFLSLLSYSRTDNLGSYVCQIFLTFGAELNSKNYVECCIAKQVGML